MPRLVSLWTSDCSAEVHQPVAADHDERLDTALDGLPGEVAGLVAVPSLEPPYPEAGVTQPGLRDRRVLRSLAPPGPGVHEHRDLPGHLPTLASPRGAVGFPRDVGKLSLTTAHTPWAVTVSRGESSFRRVRRHVSCSPYTSKAHPVGARFSGSR